MSGSAAEDAWWDPTTGRVTGSIDNPPLMINRGIGTNFGELGNYLGDVDIANVGYFQTGSIQLWQLLGFTDPNAGNLSSARRWTNIIPEVHGLVLEVVYHLMAL